MTAAVGEIRFRRARSHKQNLLSLLRPNIPTAVGVLLIRAPMLLYIRMYVEDPSDMMNTSIINNMIIVQQY